MPLPRPRHALFATLAAAMMAACSVHPAAGPFAFPPAAPAAPPALAGASAAGGTAPVGTAASAADPGRIVDCDARARCLPPPRCAASPRWRWPPERPVVVAASAAAMAPALVNVCAPVVNAGGGESAPASAAAPRASEAGEGEGEGEGEGGDGSSLLRAAVEQSAEDGATAGAASPSRVACGAGPPPAAPPCQPQAA